MTPESYDKLFYILLGISFALAPLAGLSGFTWPLYVIPVTFIGALWADNQSNKELLNDSSNGDDRPHIG